MTQRTTFIISFLLGLLAVGLGAFGAHAFRNSLEASGRMDTYELAVRYMFYHTFALIVCGMLMEKFPALKITVLLLLAGIILFSGSLLTLALTDEAGWGAVTPLGGIALLVGWGKAAWVIYKQPR